MTTIRFGLASLFAATALMASIPATAATPAAPAASGASAEVQTRYEKDRARCLGGQSGQAQETCLKEAGAARDAAAKGQLTDGSGKLRKNARDRCDVLVGDDKRDCMARIDGAPNSTESGSVKGGGIIRETVTVEPTPPASAASAR